MYCSNVGHEYRRVGATFVHYLITTEYRCTPRVYMYIVHLDGYISKKKNCQNTTCGYVEVHVVLMGTEMYTHFKACAIFIFF